MSAACQKTIMSDWKQIQCDSLFCENTIGWSNGFAVIVGGLLIKQPQVNILCSKCSRIRPIRLATTKNYIKYLSEREVLKMMRAAI